MPPLLKDGVLLVCRLFRLTGWLVSLFGRLTALARCLTLSDRLVGMRRLGVVGLGRVFFIFIVRHSISFQENSLNKQLCNTSSKIEIEDTYI